MNIIFLLCIFFDKESLIETPLNHISGLFVSSVAESQDAIMFTTWGSGAKLDAITEIWVYNKKSNKFFQVKDGRITEDFGFVTWMNNGFVLYTIDDQRLIFLDKNFFFSSLERDFLSLGEDVSGKIFFISPYSEGRSLITLRDGAFSHLVIFTPGKGAELTASYSTKEMYQTVRWAYAGGKTYIIESERDLISTCGQDFLPLEPVYKGEGPESKGYSPSMLKMITQRGGSAFTSQINMPLVLQDHVSCFILKNYDAQGKRLSTIEGRFLVVEGQESRILKHLVRPLAKLENKYFVFDKEEGILSFQESPFEKK